MLARKIFINGLISGQKKDHKHHAEKDRKKQEKIQVIQNYEDKENQPGAENRLMNTVDMTKKIRKLSPKKMNVQKNVRESFNGFPIYRECDLGFDTELASMTQNHRFDNDVESDEQEALQGSKRMYQFLVKGLKARLNIEEMQQ